jgi:hypothetical protein
MSYICFAYILSTTSLETDPYSFILQSITKRDYKSEPLWMMISIGEHTVTEAFLTFNTNQSLLASLLAGTTKQGATSIVELSWHLKANV